eukprot:6319701-Alexandrium_andersonii.AAC.1
MPSACAVLRWTCSRPRTGFALLGATRRTGTSACKMRRNDPALTPPTSCSIVALPSAAGASPH